MYIPGLYLVRLHANDSNDEGQEEIPVYQIPLFLPSFIPRHAFCDVRLAQIEWDLRYAQCTDSLDDLRDGLCLRSYVLIDKKRFQRGQRANTRSQGIVDRIQAKVNQAATRYRTARAAIESLAKILGKVSWDKHLLVLKDEDVRSLSVDDAPGSASEGRRTVSWIWIHMVGEVDLNIDYRLHESKCVLSTLIPFKFSSIPRSPN